MLRDFVWVTQQVVAGQVPILSQPGHWCRPRHPSPASAPSLVLSLSSQEELAGAVDVEMLGELFYIFVNRVSEREKRAPSSSTRKESNLAFMAMVIGLILWGSFYFFINAAIWELGS